MFLGCFLMETRNKRKLFNCYFKFFWFLDELFNSWNNFLLLDKHWFLIFVIYVIFYQILVSYLTQNFCLFILNFDIFIKNNECPDTETVFFRNVNLNSRTRDNMISYHHIVQLKILFQLNWHNCNQGGQKFCVYEIWCLYKRFN